MILIQTIQCKYLLLLFIQPANSAEIHVLAGFLLSNYLCYISPTTKHGLYYLRRFSNSGSFLFGFLFSYGLLSPSSCSNWNTCSAEIPSVTFLRQLKHDLDYLKGFSNSASFSYLDSYLLCISRESISFQPRGNDAGFSRNFGTAYCRKIYRK